MKTVSSSTTLAATSGCQGLSLPHQEPLRVSLPAVFLRASADLGILAGAASVITLVGKASCQNGLWKQAWLGQGG